MAAFVIKTDDGEVLGFLFFADEAARPLPGRCDSLFTGFPSNSALWDDPRGLFVLNHKGREWQADIGQTETKLTVKIALDAGCVFEISCTESECSWFASEDQETMSGVGSFL